MRSELLNYVTREITNLSYYVHIHISKQRNVEQKQIQNTEDEFFSEISLYYLDLHIYDVMTES